MTAMLLGAQIAKPEIAEAVPWVPQLDLDGAAVWLKWFEIQKARAAWNWTATDQAIDTLRAAGIGELGFHVQCRNSSWACKPPPAGETYLSISMPPLDMADWATFLGELAKHYAGRVQRYSIENEVAGVSWGGTVAEYVALLSTAYDAIHAADSSAIVEDSGTPGSAWGFLITSDYLAQHRDAEAVALINGYYALDRVWQVPVPFSDAASLRTWLATPAVATPLAWAQSVVDLLYSAGARCDANQIHFYHPSAYFDTVVDWVLAKLAAAGITRPLTVWEFGCKIDKREWYDPQALTNWLVQMLAHLASRRIGFALYWKLLDETTPTHWSQTPGLVVGGALNEAGLAFQVWSGKIKEGTNMELIDVGDPEVHVYKFDVAGHPWYVAWADGAQTSFQLSAGTTFSVTPAGGNSSSVTTGGIVLPVSKTPALIG